MADEMVLDSVLEIILMAFFAWDWEFKQTLVWLAGFI
jgi:hypothetical protein